MLQFLETPRFNTEIRYGMVGGPEFDTDVITVSSGAEQRNANWLDSRGRWEVGDDIYNKAEIDALIAFFRERMGQAGGFRFKDWSDWNVTRTTGVLSAITGSTTTLQLQKKYVNGSNIVYRDIRKPVPGKVNVYNSAGTLLTGLAIDTTTGVVTIASGTYTWEGEFDVPARFEVDKFSAEFAAYRDGDGEALFRVSGLSIVETR